MTSVFLSLADLANAVVAPNGTVSTSQFLDSCRQVLPVIDKLGTGMMIVRSDIGGNINRLATAQARDPARYADLFRIPLDEVARGEECGTHSETNALLWLKRAMHFIAELLQCLHDDGSMTLAAAASKAYAATLERHHSWFTSTAFTLALKIVPSREAFLDQLAPPGGSNVLMPQMSAFLEAFRPVLGAIAGFLESHGLDFDARNVCG
ncbi:hypothetical protein WJX81_007247 [Elliptochloris bilobata]|uniref:Glycolipid transfer protein domain-containing protein n=1 Tax=Elliptochloris bilobata TaxID=381761 RepID=A0AAW1S1K8_9CHLO